MNFWSFDFEFGLREFEMAKSTDGGALVALEDVWRLFKEVPLYVQNFQKLQKLARSKLEDQVN